MVKYLNSPLKATGSLLILAGMAIATFSFGQFLFLGLSVISLGILIHVTAGMLLRSEIENRVKEAFEIALVLFIFFFCWVRLLDYWGVIRLSM